MPLQPGDRLGVYEVIGALGAGGMGEVYRARDTKLDRHVAIKILQGAFATDADRRARFEREAKTLASLNHPNIAAIYGIEERALVMELVEGEDLSAHIARGPLELADALPIARQIIDALEAAHEIGIIHRDLKPANLKVRSDGTVKVLDFGLAKAVDSSGVGAGFSRPEDSPTTMGPARTELGMILGTAAYMSPEQARGRAVDKRSDVWAFGCVFYEMLTGRKAFDGEDATEIISAVVKTEPNWNAFPASVPAHVQMVITRCLVKDRKARIPDLSVVRYMLDGPITETAAPVVAASTSSRRSGWIWKAATALFVLTTLAGGFAWYRANSATAAVTRFLITAPDNMTFTAGSRPATAPVISPDGRTVVYTAQDESGKRLLYVRPIDALTAQPLPGTDEAGYPFWSPDGRFIGYAITGKLMKVALAGGLPQMICPLTGLGGNALSRGGAWNRDDIIVFNNGPAPLYKVTAAGGTATVMGTLTAGQTGHQFPSFLPDGRHVLYHATGSTDAGGVYVSTLDGGDSTRILSADSGAIYAPESGHLLFVRQGMLLAQSFNPKTFAVSGDPIRLAERVESAVVPGVVAFSISETGVLVYGTGDPADAGFQLVWIDRQGKGSESVGPLAQYRGFALSPDGTQVAAHRHDGQDTGGDIWLTDVASGRTSRFTLDASQDNSSPVWSPDSTRIAFASLRNGKWGIYAKPANYTGNEVRLFEVDRTDRLMGPVPLSWTADDRILFGITNRGTGKDLLMVSLSGNGKTDPVLQTPFNETYGQVSPDGKWLAYASSETGAPEIYVQSVSTGAGKQPISTGGGVYPRWRSDSRELFYSSRSDKLMSVDIIPTGSTFTVGVPRTMFAPGFTGATHQGDFYFYAVAKDGQRFLFSRRPSTVIGDTRQTPIVVVLNWAEGIGK